MDALRDEVLSLKTERDELKEQLSVVRLENRSMQKSMRNSGGSSDELAGDAAASKDTAEPAGLSRGVSDLRVMALRRKRDVQNLEASHQEVGGTPCACLPNIRPRQSSVPLRTH